MILRYGLRIEVCKAAFSSPFSVRPWQCLISLACFSWRFVWPKNKLLYINNHFYFIKVGSVSRRQGLSFNYLINRCCMSFSDRLFFGEQTWHFSSSWLWWLVSSFPKWNWQQAEQGCQGEIQDLYGSNFQ